MKKQTKKLQDNYSSLAENKVQHQHLEKALDVQKKDLEKKKTLVDSHNKEIKTLMEQMKKSTKRIRGIWESNQNSSKERD